MSLFSCHHPRMIDQFCHRNPVLWVLVQALQNEALCLLRETQTLRKVDFLINYFDKVILSSDLKWHPSKKQLKSENTYVPYINLVVILLFLNNLRRRIQRSPTPGIPQKRRMYGPAKITYFDNILRYFFVYLMEQNVLRLDISMDYVLIMHEFYRMTYLFHHLTNLLFNKSALFSQGWVDISSQTRLKDQVKVFFVTEKGVELDYVWMVQETLDLDFSHQLIDKTSFSFKYFFGNFLQSANKIALFMSASNEKYTAR